jgi:hypothetical protein
VVGCRLEWASWDRLTLDLTCLKEELRAFCFSNIEVPYCNKGAGHNEWYKDGPYQTSFAPHFRPSSSHLSLNPATGKSLVLSTSVFVGVRGHIKHQWVFQLWKQGLGWFGGVKKLKTPRTEHSF